MMGSMNPLLDGQHPTSTRNPAIYNDGLSDGRGVLARGSGDGGDGVGAGVNGSSDGDFAGVAGSGNQEIRRRPEYYHTTPAAYASHSRPWEVNDPDQVPRLATNPRHWERDSMQRDQHQDIPTGRPREAYDRSHVYPDRDRHQDYPMSEIQRCTSAQIPFSHGPQSVYGSGLAPSYHNTPAHSSTLPAMPAYDPVSLYRTSAARTVYGLFDTSEVRAMLTPS